jgi:beta-mannanase
MNTKLKHYIFLIGAILTMFPAIGQVYFGAKFEPKEGIYSGAGQSDFFTNTKDYFGPYNDFAKATGIKPAIAMDYVPLGLSVPQIRARFDKIKSALQPGVKLQIGVVFTGAGFVDYKRNLCRDIIAGKYDLHFEEIAKGLASLNADCFVRLGHEFDLKQYGYLGQEYKSAFIRGAEILRANCKRLALVWCSSGGSGQRWGDSSQLAKSYPGDAYVDWFGVDIFDANEWQSKHMENFLQYAYSHKKPVMIGETTPRGVGVSKGSASWAKWFAPMLQTVYKNPIIKAVCYVNWDWKVENDTRFNPGWGNWGNARIETNPFVKTAFAKEFKLKKWIHAR